MEATLAKRSARLDHREPPARTATRFPGGANKAAKTNIYGYLQGTVHADGTIDFALHELSENDLVQSKWPNAPLDAIHECFIHNSDAAE